jgi:hypothetical protein
MGADRVCRGNSAIVHCSDDGWFDNTVVALRTIYGYDHSPYRV